MPVKCAQRIVRGYHLQSCTRNGSIDRDGKTWCKQHDPQAVKARRDAQSEKWKTQWKESAARAALERAALDMAEALEATAAELAATREQLRDVAAAYWKLEHPSGAGATYQCAAYECETPAGDGSDYCEHHDPLSGDSESAETARAALRKAGRLP